MPKTQTSPYDVAEHLRTPQETAAYLEACLEESGGDAAFVVKALSDIARAVESVIQQGPTSDHDEGSKPE